jgi:hypothetical protein
MSSGASVCNLKKMSLTEDFDAFVGTKLKLRDSLVGNGFQVTDRNLRWCIVKNLPSEFGSSLQSLVVTLYNTEVVVVCVLQGSRSNLMIRFPVSLQL